MQSILGKHLAMSILHLTSFATMLQILKNCTVLLPNRPKISLSKRFKLNEFVNRSITATEFFPGSHEVAAGCR